VIAQPKAILDVMPMCEVESSSHTTPRRPIRARQGAQRTKKQKIFQDFTRKFRQTSFPMMRQGCLYTCTSVAC